MIHKPTAIRILKILRDSHAEAGPLMATKLIDELVRADEGLDGVKLRRALNLPVT